MVRYQNPDAKAGLTIPVHLVCNTPEEDLLANIKANSADVTRGWIATSAAHDSKAVLCGSGPSLADDLPVIRAMQADGATVFAMNGAANFLRRNGIMADYQVIADARERTADLVGEAHGYIFASQVHPECFRRAPGAHLFHVNFYSDHNEFLGIVDGIGPDEFALVGSHGSVGNVALGLAYAMGFRDLHVFGYDSSFREEAGHAFDQPMNVTEPVCEVEYQGKKYRCTFTMKSQADVFPRLAYELEEMGARFTVYGSGYLQDRWHGERAKTLEDRERDKYREMWSNAQYRNLIPALDHVDAAIEKLRIRSGDALVDFGCGSGRATKMFQDKGVYAVGVDIARNAVDADLKGAFVEACLWKLPPLRAEWAFCVDVMEHIPPERVDDVLAGIARTIDLRGAYFAIDSVRDELGVLIGQPLHLTVRHPAWWHRRLKDHFAHVEEYDGGVFVCSKKLAA